MMQLALATQVPPDFSVTACDQSFTLFFEELVRLLVNYFSSVMIACCFPRTSVSV